MEHNCTSEYVEEGDYLVWKNDRYILYPQKEFESKYSELPIHAKAMNGFYAPLYKI